MSDYKSKLLAAKYFLSIHPGYYPDDIIKSEKPDIHYKNHYAGLEVTRAFSRQEGLFYSDMNGKIRNREILDTLSTGQAQITEDTNDIIKRVLQAIHTKTELAPSYLKENPWIKNLALAVIIGYDLELYDLEIVTAEMSEQTKKYYSEILLIMPSIAYSYNGWEFTRINP